jgi:hypothetical protein
MTKIDWNAIPKPYNWAAIDIDGSISIFTHRPRCVGIVWLVSQGSSRYVGDVIDADLPRTESAVASTLQYRPTEPLVSEMFSG